MVPVAASGSWGLTSSISCCIPAMTRILRLPSHGKAWISLWMLLISRCQSEKSCRWMYFSSMTIPRPIKTYCKNWRNSDETYQPCTAYPVHDTQGLNNRMSSGQAPRSETAITNRNPKYLLECPADCQIRQTAGQFQRLKSSLCRQNLTWRNFLPAAFFPRFQSPDG